MDRMIKIIHSGSDPEGTSKLYEKAAQTHTSHTFVVLTPIPQFIYKVSWGKVGLASFNLLTEEAKQSWCIRWVSAMLVLTKMEFSCILVSLSSGPNGQR